MATETELKLSIDPTSVNALLQHPLLQGAPLRQHLSNTYFDTDDLILTQKKVAVRERRVNDQTLLTVKTAGESLGGLSRRREWEAPTQPGAFDFKTLIDDAALATSLNAYAQQLIPVFTTDFERLSWRITSPVGEVEVALDQGEILVSRHGHNALAPICELELELKGGSVDAVLALAQQLQSTVTLTPTDESKAARGYQLFNALAT